MKHFSVPVVVFCLKKQNRFPQRNEPPSAKTELFCRKAVPASAGRREKQGFGGLFPLWMESARAQTPFVLLQAISLVGLTWEAGSGRMAFRGGRQNVAESGFRLSSCIPLGARGSRIFVLFPFRARLRSSRRGCLDVLTECYWGICCCLPAFWLLCDWRRPAPSKRARECPRPIFLFFPEPLKYTAVPTFMSACAQGGAYVEGEAQAMPHFPFDVSHLSAAQGCSSLNRMRYCPYWFLSMGRATSRSFSASIHPCR